MAAAASIVRAPKALLKRNHGYHEAKSGNRVEKWRLPSILSEKAIFKMILMCMKMVQKIQDGRRYLILS